jgi:hypothetical protein
MFLIGIGASTNPNTGGGAFSSPCCDGILQIRGNYGALPD